MGVTVATLEDVQRVVEEAVARRDGVRRLAWSVAEVAKSLKTSPDSVRRLIREGHLPVVPYMGTRQLVPVSALEEFVSAGAVGSAGDTLPSLAGPSGPSGSTGTDACGSVSPLRPSSPAGQDRAGGPSSTADDGSDPPSPA